MALVLVDAMGLGPEMSMEARLYFRAGPERLAGLLGPERFKAISRLPDTPLHHKLDALDYELMRVPGGRPEATRAFNLLVPLMGGVFHRAERLGEVKQPTLLYWGEYDRVLPELLAEAALRALPRARLTRVRTGHSPQQEQPEETTAALLAVLGA